MPGMMNHRRLAVGLLLCSIVIGQAPRAWAGARGGFERIKSSFEDWATSEPPPPVVWDAPDMSAEIPSKTAAAKEWTVMVYMNGRNDLWRHVWLDINEMEQVGSTPDINVVVEAGSIRRVPDARRLMPFPPEFPPPARMYITRDVDAGRVTSPLIQEADADMGDWRHLADFVRWAKENYPARRTMLIVWNHGSGWKPMGFTRAGISEDAWTGHSMTTVELGSALAQAGGLNIYVSDACRMQATEVAYEIRGSAGVIIGSEEKEPNDGQSYAAFLGALAGDPRASDEEISRTYVRAFGDYYAPRIGVTQSAVRSSALPGLTALLGEWTDAIMSADDREAVTFAKQNAKSFADRDAKDLYDFVRIASGRAKSEEVRAKGEKLMAYIRQDVVIENAVVTQANQHAYGLSIYIPQYNDYLLDYDELAWSRDGKWDEFLRWVTSSWP